MSHLVYVVTVRDCGDGTYRAVAHSGPSIATGVASTIAGAILAAVTEQRLPELPPVSPQVHG